MKKAVARVTLIALFFSILSGCHFPSSDDFFSLPRQSESYVQLQEKIDEIVNSGGEFLAPTSGSNRQSVQLKDLDGDGVQEAVAFFVFRDEEKPLRIIIFRRTDDDEGYEVAAQIEGAGTSIASVTYSDLNWDGTLELVVGWQMSTELRMVSLFSLKDYKVTELLQSQYSAYTVMDIDGEGRMGLFVLHQNVEGFGTVQLYLFDGLELGQYETYMSEGVQTLRRMKTGCLNDMTPALVVTSAHAEGDYITDIYAFYDGELYNVTTFNSNGASAERLPYSHIYAVDINGDQVTDVPRIRYLKPLSETQSYWVLDWFCYDRNGNTQSTITTYHNYSDSWYMIMQPEWRNKITIRRTTSALGINTVVFSIYQEDEETGSPTSTDFLRIYTLTGENRYDRAAISGRFVLEETTDVIYAAQILLGDGDWEYTPTEELVRESFNLIISEWETGLVS